MPLPIGGLVPQKIAIKNAQGVLEQLLIAIGKKLGVNNLSGETPAAVPYSIDFSVLPSPQNIDLSNTQLKNQLGQIKSIFIDNSGNTASVTLTAAITRQQLIIPAGYQAYLPVASTVSQFQVSTSGEALVGFDFLNVDVEPALWSASPSTTTIGSVLFAGSAGTDHSVNQPAYPPAGLSLLQTVAANTSRALIGVQVQGANPVQIYQVNASGNTTLIILNPVAAGVGGGAWTSQTFKGQLTVYGTAGDQVSIYEN